MDKKKTSRILVSWVASFLLAAVLLIFYFRAPILPICLAGVLTLALVFFKEIYKK